MRRLLAVLLACAPILSVPAPAQVVERAVAPVSPIVPVIPSGAFLKALTLQTNTLSAAPMALPQAFQATIAPAPLAAAAAPEAFAARAALTEALAAPQTGLPALAATARAAGTEKGENAAKALEQLHQTIQEAPAKERRDLAKEAAKLNAMFDGSTAAPGEGVDLSQIPTVEEGPGKKKSEKERLKEIEKIRLMQKEMYAGGTHSVLVVLDGLDSAGKGGVVDAFRGINPSWTRTEQFKKPTPEEFAEHFLARTKRKAPQAGESKIVFFDRSHYEDIIVPTVMRDLHAKDAANPKAMFSDEEIESRYKQVMDFEREMAARGVTIVKIYLNMSKDEQYKRLNDRLEKPDKRWKSPADKKGKISDHETRKNWDFWVKARHGIIARTTPWWSQWHVVGADDKGTRDLAAVKLVRKAMERMRLSFPQHPEMDGIVVPK